NHGDGETRKDLHLQGSCPLPCREPRDLAPAVVGACPPRRSEYSATQATVRRTSHRAAGQVATAALYRNGTAETMRQTRFDHLLDASLVSVMAAAMPVSSRYDCDWRLPTLPESH